MLNDLMKTFFDTFGIEPKQKCAKPLLKTTSWFCKAYKNCVGCDYNDLKYPQITDSILLELICIRCKELISIIKVKGDNREELKNYILKLCIDDYTFLFKNIRKNI